MVAMIIDASVALEWYLEEEGGAAARELLTSRNRRLAPSFIFLAFIFLAFIFLAFIFLEVQYVLSVAARRGRLDRKAIELAETALLQSFDTLAPVEQLMMAAAKLSRDFDRPIYDCLYAALALHEAAPLATADAKQAEMARQAGAKTLSVG